MLNVKYIHLAISLFAFVFANATVTEPQQEPVLVVHNTNNFYVLEGSISVQGVVITTNNNLYTNVVGVYTATPKNENPSITKELWVTSKLKKLPTNPHKISKKTTSQTAEVKKPIVQKTTVACPFGNYPTGNHNFYALHNGVATAPTPVKTSKYTSKYFIKTSPPTSPDVSGGEFSHITTYFGYNSPLLWRGVRGEVTTRPPPFLMINC